VVRAIRDAGLEMAGFEGVLASDVPRGAGLSSSAALEVGLAMVLLPRPPAPAVLAPICRRAENVYVGVQSGIMDQLSSAAGVAGSALLIDCRTLDVRRVSVPDDLAVLVVDSGVRRSLTDGRYNEVRRDLDEAAWRLGVAALRDVDGTQLAEAERSGALSGSVLARARHVVGENRRTLDAAAALEAGRLDEVAALFAASHRSLAADLRVSSQELDALVEIAGRTPGVVASRMTGAGFGGCTVNLVRAAAATRASAAILAAYRERTGREGRAWISRPGDGAGRAPWHG
jgi:galactokinase